MAVAGFFEILVLSSWFLLPLGVPPGPEDPLLAKAAPEKCLYYVSSAGTVAPNPNSANRTEQLLLDPEVKEFYEQLFPRIKKSLNQMIAQQGAPPEAVAVTGSFPVFFETLLTEPTAVFVSDAKLQPGGPLTINGALIVNISRNKRDVTKALDNLRPIMAQVLKPIEIAGDKYSSIDAAQMPPGFPLVTFGVSDDYFILGLGEGSVAETLKRMTTPAPAWLTETQELLKVPRRSTLAYADLKAIMAFAKQAVGPNETIDQVLQETGLLQVKSYINVTGLDKEGWVGGTLLRVDGEPTGWLSLLGEKPLGATDLEAIPDDAMLAFAGRVDADKVFAAFKTMLGVAGEADELDRAVLGVKQLTGVDIQQELIPQLGDVWQLYASPREGDVITGWTALVTIRDSDKVTAMNDRITGRVQEMFAGQFRAPRVKTSEFAGHKLQTFVIPDDDFLVAPTWCITDDRLVFALFPQAVKTYLRGNEGGKSLTDAPEMASLFAAGDGPTFVAYNDTATIVRRVYPFVQIGLRAFLSEMQQEGLDIDLSMLPSCDAITRHLRPGTQSVRWTKDGLYSESRQTVPTGNIGAVLPIAMAGIAPATMEARVAAQRNQGMNNMRQIALAMLNYESAMGAFPARHSTDENGKPLLSWRVHILPYTEHTGLYEQFKLDEPWNSPHNRKLIAQMPDVFKAPGSMADPGKTTYLAIESDESVIVPPKENESRFPKGRQIREVQDGTSKTVMVVGANDQSAMIWTKPGDFELDEEDPFKGLVGQQGTFPAVFCDGHVTTLTKALGKDVLRLLIDVADGQPVNAF